ncbi:MAG: Hsp20/alpha crystallin family protein [Sulfolobaceae archaeon]
MRLEDQVAMCESMPAGKDLYDIMREMIEKYEKKINIIFEELEREFKEIESYEKPLYSLYEDELNYYIIVDIPNVTDDSVKVSVNRNKKLLMLNYQDKKGKSHNCIIRLPSNADYSTINFSLRKGFLKVTIKKLS